MESQDLIEYIKNINFENVTPEMLNNLVNPKLNFNTYQQMEITRIISFCLNNYMVDKIKKVISLNYQFIEYLSKETLSNKIVLDFVLNNFSKNYLKTKEKEPNTYFFTIYIELLEKIRLTNIDISKYLLKDDILFLNYFCTVTDTKNYNELQDVKQNIMLFQHFFQNFNNYDLTKLSLKQLEFRFTPKIKRYIDIIQTNQILSKDMEIKYLKKNPELIKYYEFIKHKTFLSISSNHFDINHLKLKESDSSKILLNNIQITSELTFQELNLLLNNFSFSSFQLPGQRNILNFIEKVITNKNIEDKNIEEITNFIDNICSDDTILFNNLKLLNFIFKKIKQEEIKKLDFFLDEITKKILNLNYLNVNNQFDIDYLENFEEYLKLLDLLVFNGLQQTSTLTIKNTYIKIIDKLNLFINNYTQGKLINKRDIQNEQFEKDLDVGTTNNSERNIEQKKKQQILKLENYLFDSIIKTNDNVNVNSIELLNDNKINTFLFNVLYKQYKSVSKSIFRSFSKIQIEQLCLNNFEYYNELELSIYMKELGMDLNVFNLILINTHLNNDNFKTKLFNNIIFKLKMKEVIFILNKDFSNFRYIKENNFSHLEIQELVKWLLQKKSLVLKELMLLQSKTTIYETYVFTKNLKQQSFQQIENDFYI